MRAGVDADRIPHSSRWASWRQDTAAHPDLTHDPPNVSGNKTPDECKTRLAMSRRNSPSRTGRTY